VGLSTPRYSEQLPRPAAALTDHETWLKLVHELLLAIHEGLQNAQLASPDFRHAFAKLNGPKSSIGGRVYSVLSALTHFFWSDNEDMLCEGFLKTHCFHYIQSANIPPLPDTLQSVQLTTKLDHHRVCETLLNTMVQDVHHEVDEWHMAQCMALITQVVDLITADPHANASTLSAMAFDLDPRLITWVNGYCDKMWSHVCRTLAGDVQVDMIDIWGQEHLETLLMVKHMEVATAATASFDCQDVWDARVAELTAKLEKDWAAQWAAMVSARQQLLNAECATLTTATDEELGCLQNDLRVRVEEEKARGEVLCSDLV
jgi:hypothetical protein